MEGCQDGHSEQSPNKGCKGSRLHSPLQVHTVLHPPRSDVRAAQSKEEGRDAPLCVGASLDSGLHL